MRYIQQAKYHPAWANPHEIVMVASLSLAIVGSGQLRLAEFRNRRLYRFWQGPGRLFVLEEEAHRTIDRRS